MSNLVAHVFRCTCWVSLPDALVLDSFLPVCVAPSLQRCKRSPAPTLWGAESVEIEGTSVAALVNDVHARSRQPSGREEVCIFLHGDGHRLLNSCELAAFALLLIPQLCTLFQVPVMRPSRPTQKASATLLIFYLIVCSSSHRVRTTTTTTTTQKSAENPQLCFIKVVDIPVVMLRLIPVVLVNIEIHQLIVDKVVDVTDVQVCRFPVPSWRKQSRSHSCSSSSW